MKETNHHVHLYGNKGFNTKPFDPEQTKKPKKRSEHKRFVASMKRSYRKTSKKRPFKDHAGFLFSSAKENGKWVAIETGY